MSGNSNKVIEIINKFLEMTEAYDIEAIHACFSSMQSNNHIISSHMLFNTLIDGTSDKKEFILLNILNEVINSNNAELFNYILSLLPTSAFDINISEYYKNKEKPCYIYTFIINSCINNNSLNLLNQFLYHLELNKHKIQIILDICVSKSKKHPIFSENILIAIIEHTSVRSYITVSYLYESYTETLLSTCYEITINTKTKLKILSIIFNNYRHAMHANDLFNFDIRKFYNHVEYIILLLQNLCGFKQLFYSDLKYNFNQIFLRCEHDDSMAPLKIAAYLNLEDKSLLLPSIQVDFSFIYDNFRDKCEKLFDNNEFIDLIFNYNSFAMQIPAKHLLYIIQKHLNSQDKVNYEFMTKLGFLLSRIGIDKITSDHEQINFFNKCVTDFKDICQTNDFKIKSPLYFEDLYNEQKNLTIPNNTNINELFDIFIKITENCKDFDKKYLQELKNRDNPASPLTGICFGLANAFILAKHDKSDVFNNYMYLQKLTKSEIQDVHNNLQKQSLTPSDLKTIYLTLSLFEYILPLHGVYEYPEKFGNIVTDNNFVDNIYFQVSKQNMEYEQVFQSFTHIFNSTDIFENSNIEMIHITDIVTYDAKAFLVAHRFIDTGHTIAVCVTDDPETYLIYDSGFFMNTTPQRVYKGDLIPFLINYAINFNISIYQERNKYIDNDIINGICMDYYAYLKKEKLDLTFIFPFKLKKENKLNLSAYQNHLNNSNQNNSTFDSSSSSSSASRHTTKHTL